MASFLLSPRPRQSELHAQGDYKHTQTDRDGTDNDIDNDTAAVVAVVVLKDGGKEPVITKWGVPPTSTV